jgi:hypothetical protein
LQNVVRTFPPSFAETSDELRRDRAEALAEAGSAKARKLLSARRGVRSPRKRVGRTAKAVKDIETLTLGSSNRELGILNADFLINVYLIAREGEFSPAEFSIPRLLSLTAKLRF